MSDISKKLSLTLFDSATGEVKPAPSKEHVSFYACGITPYSSSHIGHGRSFVVFDQMVRLLRQSGKKVMFVRNITDIDDKIIQEAKKQNMSWHELSAHFAEENRTLFNKMGILEDVLEPKASEHLNDMFFLIEKMMEKDLAYVSETGDVLFDTQKGTQGSFVQVDKDKLMGGRVASTGKRHEEDFVLWKKAKEDEPSFEGPFGRGRPGWHLECSSMIFQLLGEQIDYHGGGVDLKFPHHHAECLQTHAVTGKDLAKHWLHHGVIRDEVGRKMSKSLGNVIYLKDAISYAEKLAGAQGGELLRLALLGTIWTKPMDFSYKLLDQMWGKVKHWAEALDERIPQNKFVDSEAIKSLFDNMNTPLFFTKMHKLAEKAKQGDENSQDALSYALFVFGVSPSLLKQSLVQEVSSENEEVIASLLKQRDILRQEKNFKEADRLRDRLVALGWNGSDAPLGQSFKP